MLAARRAGLRVDHALTVVVPGTSYDESSAARAMACALDLELEILPIDLPLLADLLHDAVRATACAFYNLHPVARLVLGRAARARGFDALLTGDGADQAARGAVGAADYVPHVAALTRAAGLSWAAPFASDDVVEHLVAQVDPERADPKASLRALAVSWGVPEELAFAPKRATYAPPLPVRAFPPSARVARLARALDRGLAWSNDDRTNVGIASLSALVDVFGIEV